MTPIRRSRFAEHATRLRSLTRLALRDVPVDPRGPAHAPLTALPSSNGHVLLSFVESIQRGHAFLEDVSLHRRVYAIVGVADAEEWDDAAAMQAEFERVVGLQASVSVARCFVFGAEPGKRKADSPILSIPASDQGKGALFAAVCELAGGILRELSDVVRRFKSAHLTPQYNSLDGRQSISTPSESMRDNPFERVASPPPVAKDASSSSKGSPTIAQSDALSPPGRSRTPANGDSLYAKAFGNPQLRLSVHTTDGATLGEAKLRRRTQGRIIKLRGDLQLLAGRPDEALASYNEAITSSKLVSDDVWHAAALEASISAQILMVWLPTVVGTAFAQQQSAAGPLPVDLSTLGVQPAADTFARDLAAARETPTKFAQALQLYARLPVFVAGTDTLLPNAAALVVSGDAAHPITYVEACLRAAFVSTCVWASGGWTPAALQRMVDGPSSFAPDPKAAPPLALSLRSGIARASIADPLALVATVQPRLAVADRLRALATIASLYGVIGYARKRASTLLESAAVAADAVRPVGAPQRPAQANGISKLADVVRSAPDTAGNESIIRLVEKACDTYGVRIVASLGPDRSHRRTKSSIGGPDARTAVVHAEPHGWPDLQLAVVTDAISVSELLPDHQAALRFTISSLRELAAHMPPMQQFALSQTIPRTFAAAARRATRLEMEYWGPADLVMSLEAIPCVVVR